MSRNIFMRMLPKSGQNTRKLALPILYQSSRNGNDTEINFIDSCLLIPVTFPRKIHILCGLLRITRYVCGKRKIISAVAIGPCFHHHFPSKLAFMWVPYCVPCHLLFPLWPFVSKENTLFVPEHQKDHLFRHWTLYDSYQELVLHNTTEQHKSSNHPAVMLFFFVTVFCVSFYSNGQWIEKIDWKKEGRSKDFSSLFFEVSPEICGTTEFFSGSPCIDHPAMAWVVSIELAIWKCIGYPVSHPLDDRFPIEIAF